MARTTLKVSTTELSRHFGDYLSRVRFDGQTVLVMKNNSPVAELRALPGEGCTLRDFVEILGSLPADEKFADDLEKVNAADRPLENPWV